MEQTFEELVNMVLSIRDDARRKGDWTTADNIRDSLREMGVVIEDTAVARWHLKPLSGKVSLRACSLFF